MEVARHFAEAAASECDVQRAQLLLLPARSAYLVVALLGEPVVDVAALDVAALGGGDVRRVPLRLLALVRGLVALRMDVALLVRLGSARAGLRAGWGEG